MRTPRACTSSRHRRNDIGDWATAYAEATSARPAWAIHRDRAPRLRQRDRQRLSWHGRHRAVPEGVPRARQEPVRARQDLQPVLGRAAKPRYGRQAAVRAHGGDGCQVGRGSGHPRIQPDEAIVGATVPEEQKVVRELLPSPIFLVLVYGAQATAKDIATFNDDLSPRAIVNSSRGNNAHGKRPARTARTTKGSRPRRNNLHAGRQNVAAIK